MLSSIFFFFNDTATTEIYTLSLHDALPISHDDARRIERLTPHRLRRVAIGEHVDAGAPQHPRPDLGEPRRAARVQDLDRHARSGATSSGHGKRGVAAAVSAACRERRDAGDQCPTSAFQKSTVSRRSGQRPSRSEEHTSELQSQSNIVCRLLLETNTVL